MSLIVALILVASISNNKLLFTTVPSAAPFQGWNQWKIDKLMPDTLDIDYLLSLPKYRNIHHDSFCREDNLTEIGNNALPDRPNIMAYKTFNKGDICVGIKNGCAVNQVKKTKFGRCIKYINARREDYHITAVNSDNIDSKTCIAFFIKDIDNFYYASLTKYGLDIYKFIQGKKRRVYKQPSGGKRLEVYVNGKNSVLLVDGKSVTKVIFRENYNFDTLCGLFFDSKHISEIEDFLVDYPDSFDDAKIDEAVENNEVDPPFFGTYCANKGVCTAEINPTNHSKRSYRFLLEKPNQHQVDDNRNHALHSTIMLDGICAKGGNNFYAKKGGNKPLDSFVLSLDVLFPAEGDERWELDELFQELFIQEHHVGYKIPFSPSLSIVIKKGRLYLSTIWLESIAKETSVKDNNLIYREEYVGRINNDEEELYLSNKGAGDMRYLPLLERGKWHNITLYVKLGYNENQQPRTVLYFDNLKVVDWHTPNAYNCQEYGEYMEFGIYKWNWNTQENRDRTPIKRRVLYFDNIKYYI